MLRKKEKEWLEATKDRALKLAKMYDKLSK